LQLRAFAVALLIAALSAALAGATSAAPTKTNPSASSAGSPIAVDSAKCVARIRKMKGMYVPFYEKFY
jgi:hypothetical protein